MDNYYYYSIELGWKFTDTEMYHFYQHHLAHARELDM